MEHNKPIKLVVLKIFEDSWLHIHEEPNLQNTTTTVTMTFDLNLKAR